MFVKLSGVSACRRDRTTRHQPSRASFRAACPLHTCMSGGRWLLTVG